VKAGTKAKSDTGYDWAPNVANEGPVADYVGTRSADQQQKLNDAVARAYLDGEPDGARSYAATAWVAKEGPVAENSKTPPGELIAMGEQGCEGLQAQGLSNR